MLPSLFAFLFFLAASDASHVCVHDKVTRNVTQVRAPPSDGATFRRDAVVNPTPIRIVPLYRASNGGTDISTEVGMSVLLKVVVESAMIASLARFSTLLRVTPVSGNLFAYRSCRISYESINKCVAFDEAPKCGDISLASMLGSQTYYPLSPDTPATLPATGEGVPNADTVIFVTAQQTSNCVGSTLAYASYCQQASNDRPTFGYINFCPSRIPVSTTAANYGDFLSTVLHELTHVLVFSSLLFPYFRDEQGVARTPRNSNGDPTGEYFNTFSCNGGSSSRFVASPSTISYASERGMSCSWGSATTWATANIPYGSGTKTPNDCVARISTPRVAAAAQTFFGCSTLAGADLENQDTGQCFVQGSHWDERTMSSEYMSAISSKGSKISPMTLAVFEDSGWYSVAYNNGDAWVAGKDWGYKQGCAFATEKCSPSNVGTPPHFYFSAALGDVEKCTLNRLEKGVVKTQAYTTALPLQYQYFSTSTWGGTSFVPGYEVYDFCPQVISKADCSDTASSVDPTYGEVVGVGSLCHMSTLKSDGLGPSSLNTGCYRVSCASNSASYTLTAMTSAVATCTTEGAFVTFSGYGGSVECGNPAFVCGSGSTGDGNIASTTSTLTLTYSYVPKPVVSPPSPQTTPLTPSPYKSPCPVGFYATSSEVNAPCTPCPIGTTSPQGSVSSGSCALGVYQVNMCTSPSPLATTCNSGNINCAAITVDPSIVSSCQQLTQNTLFGNMCGIVTPASPGFVAALYVSTTYSTCTCTPSNLLPSSLDLDSSTCTSGSGTFAGVSFFSYTSSQLVPISAYSCSAGYYNSNGGTVLSSCTACPSGQTSPPGSFSPNACVSTSIQVNACLSTSPLPNACNSGPSLCSSFLASSSAPPSTCQQGPQNTAYGNICVTVSSLYQLYTWSIFITSSSVPCTCSASSKFYSYSSPLGICKSMSAALNGVTFYGAFQTSPLSTSSPSTSSTTSSTNVGAIVGGVLGGLAGVILLTFLIRANPGSQSGAPNNPAAPPAPYPHLSSVVAMQDGGVKVPTLQAIPVRTLTLAPTSNYGLSNAPNPPPMEIRTVYPFVRPVPEVYPNPYPRT